MNPDTRLDIAQAVFIGTLPVLLVLVLVLLKLNDLRKALTERKPLS